MQREKESQFNTAGGSVFQLLTFDSSTLHCS